MIVLLLLLQAALGAPGYARGTDPALSIVTHRGAPPAPSPPLHTPGRRYWPVSVDSLATGKVAHTHVAVTGIVRRQRMQGDGDRHIALGGRRAVILAECIPALPCPAPVVGQRITVYGISRWDLEHHWAEVHPCERWEPAL